MNISSFNDSILWTCGTAGTIWNTTNGGEPLVGIETISSEIPRSFNLKQNYPNPFNSSTNIEFDIRFKNKYTLEIFNSIGKLKVILIEKELTVGSYKVNFTSENLSSGVYYYKLSSEDFVDTKKFILIK